MNIVDPEIVSLSIELPRASYELAVPDKLYYLQGHFPGKPILAGVVQLHWAIQLARTVFTSLNNFKGMEALKFHRIIEPHTPLTLLLEQYRASYSIDAAARAAGDDGQTVFFFLIGPWDALAGKAAVRVVI